MIVQYSSFPRVQKSADKFQILTSAVKEHLTALQTPRA